MKIPAFAIAIGGVLAIGAAVVVIASQLWDGVAILSDTRPSASVPAPATGQSLPVEIQFTPSPTARPVPDLAFIDGEGNPRTLADFRGRAVLLNIWATWCVPCRREMPTLDRLQAKLGGSDFEVVALSIDRNGLDAVKPFYRELGLKSLGIYIDQSGKAASKLGTLGVPTTLLIDREGREVARKLGPEEWDSPEVIERIQQYAQLPIGDSAQSRGRR